MPCSLLLADSLGKKNPYHLAYAVCRDICSASLNVDTLSVEVTQMVHMSKATALMD